MGGGCNEYPRPLGAEGHPRDQELRGWRCNPRASRGTLYWSLGLRRFQGSGLFFLSQL